MEWYLFALTWLPSPAWEVATTVADWVTALTFVPVTLLGFRKVGI